MQIRKWCGKRFEDMTKEELIEALTWAAKRIDELYIPECRNLRIKDKIERIKMGAE